MRIFFVRHGESVGNATGDYSSMIHDNLSEKGLVQALSLVKGLKDLNGHFFYCSPLKRAIQTALPFAKAVRAKIEIWPELAEACWQDEKTVKEETQLRLIEAENLRVSQKDFFSFRNSQVLRPMDDETYSEGIFRIRKAFDLLLVRHGGKDENVVVISHGHTLSRIMEMFLNISPDGRFEHDNTGVSMLEEKHGTFKVIFANRIV